MLLPKRGRKEIKVIITRPKLANIAELKEGRRNTPYLALKQKK